MKKLLILTKRNFDDALFFWRHVKYSVLDWDAELNTENINESTLKNTLHEFDLIWMYYYPYIVKKETLELNKHWVNTHPSYLPYNRGSAPNFFSIVSNTPAGVSVHKVAEMVDRGDIIARREVVCKPHWTGEDLYNALLAESLSLSIATFNDELKYITETEYEWESVGTSQQKLAHNNNGTNTMKQFYELHDLNKIWEQTHNLQYIMRIIRASTFGDYDGAYYTDEDGNRIEIKGVFKVLK